MSYEAVIFDNDGVLTEPTPIEVFREAVREAFAEFDVEPTTEAVDCIVHGKPTRVRRICELHGVDHDEFWARHEARSAAAQRAVLEAGAKPLYDDVEALFDLRVPLGVVSNNQHATVEHVVDVHGLGDLFSVAYGREPSVEGLRRIKPSPHYLRRALAALDVEDALYVGDSNADLLAASRAGVDSAYVRRPHRTGYELAAEPTHVLDSLRDLPALA
ncbi:MAG: HAD family hydrolase [Salinigranum sp.]